MVRVHCSKHGRDVKTAWVPCWNGCNNGYFDAREVDPELPVGTLDRCPECEGKGGWQVCAECNREEPEL